MCRSLWQTPAALTRIRTCVPDGPGVGSSISFKGALKSTTLKLFMAFLPPAVLSSSLCLGRAHVVGKLSQRREMLLQKSNLLQKRAGVFAERRRPLAGSNLCIGHPERHVHDLERPAVVRDFGQRLAVGKLRIGQCLSHRAVGR